MKKLFFLLVVLILLAASPLMAQDKGVVIYNSMTNSDLLKDCRSMRKLIGVTKTESIEDVILANNCREFIRGVVNANDMFVGMKWLEPHYCIAKETDLTQLTLDVLSYLEEHPEELRLSAVTGVHNAFVEKYPCVLPKSSKGGVLKPE